MQSVKRDLVLGSSISALVLACALAWGSPFVSNSNASAVQAQNMPQQGSQNQSKSQTFSGTIAKQGDGYVLRASDGQTYKLDSADQAQAYEGKTVTVTGQLDSESKTIHVESIAGS